MAEVDTSSYPKPAPLPAQKSMLDQVGQYQTLESQGLTINKQKLEMINTQFGLMNAELSTMVNDTSITKEQAAKRLSTFAQTYKFPPQVAQHMIQELNASPDVPTFAKIALTRGMQTQEKVNNLYGNPGFLNNGQTNTPVITSPMLNGGLPRQTGLPIQQQIPPTTPVVGSDNVPTLQGPTPAITPAGTASGPQRLPIAPTQQGFRSGLSTETPNQVVQNRYPQPSGPSVGNPPLFDEGKRMLTEDQSIASKRMFSVKPALDALKIMKQPGFISGPGSEGYTQFVAALKTAGVITTQAENDPTVMRQQVNKYLAQYLSGSPIAQRSDAAQALTEASSPNPKTQLTQTLIKLTEDAVALDRAQAAMPNAFKDKDLSKYGQHKSVFPQSIDARAFKLDYMDNSEKIVDQMRDKLKKNKHDKEAIKFFKSLSIADEQGFYK